LENLILVLHNIGSALDIKGIHLAYDIGAIEEGSW
jgi:hypothetical protein